MAKLDLRTYRNILSTINDSRRDTQALLDKYGITLSDEPNQAEIDQATIDSLYKSVDDFEKFLRS